MPLVLPSGKWRRVIHPDPSPRRGVAIPAAGFLSGAVAALRSPAGLSLTAAAAAIGAAWFLNLRAESGLTARTANRLRSNNSRESMR
mgnify:CR=1 FL=1|jgi:hypothetical protein